MSYFFFSYARTDNNPYLQRFYNDLCEEVRLLVGGLLADAGFRDAASIKIGERWSDVLVDELMSCRVFIAVYSPSYFLSDNCGKEWAAFTQRMQMYAESEGVNPPSIISVQWAPTLNLPSIASSIQWNMEVFGEVYEEEGLLFLMQHRNTKHLYKSILRALALRIRDVASQYCLPTPPVRFAHGNVRSAFQLIKSDGTTQVIANPQPVDSGYVLDKNGDLEDRPYSTDHRIEQLTAVTAVAIRALPPDINGFTGRVADIDKVYTYINDVVARGGAVGIHAVDGMAGVGKTAFAVHIAHMLSESFPDAQLFLPLHAHTPGQRPVDPADALATLLLVRGMTARQIPDGLVRQPHLRS